MAYKLVKCKNCGGNAELLNFRNIEFTVRCLFCQSMLKEWHESRQKAVDDWNKVNGGQEDDD